MSVTAYSLSASWADMEDEEDARLATTMASPVSVTQVPQVTYKSWSSMVQNRVEEPEQEPEQEPMQVAEPEKKKAKHSERPKVEMTEVQCKSCEGPLRYNAKFYDEKGYKYPSVCKTCKESGHVGRDVMCYSCNKTFHFSYAQQQHYKKMKYQDPKKCFDCRKKQ
jgi:hypothetical protein